MCVEIATRFFKGPEGVRNNLVENILAELKRTGRDATFLDERCRFAPKGMPTFKEILVDRKKMTPLHFSIASNHLNIAIDKALSVNFSGEDRLWVYNHMEQHGARVVSNCGDAAPVQKEEFAPVYVILKSLQAIDPAHARAASEADAD